MIRPRAPQSDPTLFGCGTRLARACRSMIADTELKTDRSVYLDESNAGYFGWRVALAACLGVMGGFGSLFVYTFTVFVKPLGSQFGWNRESVSLGFAIAAMTVGMASPLIGRLIDRFGPRYIILPSIAIFGCGIASFALLGPGIWQFYLICFVIGVVGNGAAHLAYARSISTWFERRLGVALAFVMVGAGLGAMILPVLAQSVVTRSGWRAAYLTLGVTALLLGLPRSTPYSRSRVEKSAEMKHSLFIRYSPFDRNGRAFRVRKTRQHSQAQTSLDAIVIGE